MDFIFEIYTEMVEPMQQLFRKRLPAKDFAIEVEHGGQTVQAKASELANNSERKAHRIAYNFTIRSAACDVIRCILPASTQANLGLVGNGRFYTGLISKLLTQDLTEGRVLADKIREALNHQIPTFIKRAAKNKYQAGIDAQMRTLSKELFRDIPIETAPEVVLLEDRPEDFEIHLMELSESFKKTSRSRRIDLCERSVTQCPAASVLIILTWQ